MKRTGTIIVILVLVVLLTACGSTANSSGGKTFTIGFSLSTLTNPFFVGMDRGMRNEAAKMKVRLIDKNANGDASTQVSQIEDLITQKVDLLIINPISADGIVPVVQQANNAKIPVIAVDRGSNGGTLVSFVQTDGVAMGKQAVDWIAQQLTQRYGSAKGNIVDMQGLRGTTPAEDREKGFKEELQKYPNIHVVATQAANFDQETAYNVTADILQAHPNVDAIFAANDDMAVGASKEIQASKRFYPAGNSKHIFIIGIDGSGQALHEIRGGTMDATISQNPPKEASLAVDLAVQYLQGKQVPKNAFVPTMLITQSNIDSQDVKNYGLWGEAK
jgi:ribose transport system substrate-binding protein